MKIKTKIFLAVVLILSGCTANHQHDGLYLANKAIMGITKAWILQGDELTIYSMGIIDVKRCKQYADRLEVEGGDSFDIIGNGDIVVAKDTAKNVDYRMLKLSDRTDYSLGELNKLVNDAYENERKNR